MNVAASNPASSASKRSTRSSSTPAAAMPAALSRNLIRRAGAIGRLEMLLRLGLEADHGRREPQFAAAFPECRQDRLVPEVQAVKVADGYRAPGVRVATGFETTSNQHGPAASGIRALQL